MLRDTLSSRDKIFVNKLVHTYVSLLHVPYHNPQSDDYTADFIIVNGEVIYTANISDFQFSVLSPT
jgi:hypothetical protein